MMDHLWWQGFLLAGSWKCFNDFIIEISKGGEVGDTFIGNTNHSYIIYKIDSAVGLGPGPEGIISSRRHSSSYPNLLANLQLTQSCNRTQTS